MMAAAKAKGGSSGVGNAEPGSLAAEALAAAAAAEALAAAVAAARLGAVATAGRAAEAAKMAALVAGVPWGACKQRDF